VLEGISLVVSDTCEKVVGKGILCMVCDDAEATGHVQVSGGPFSGRVLLLVCRLCARPEQDVERRLTLAGHMTAGWLDPETLGPGAGGVPMMRHEGHLDPLEEAHA
jgi:hypothetical protein